VGKDTFNQEDWTTIAILRETKKGLDNLKAHPKQSYDEVIQGLLKEAKSDG